jgi:hypothetical protein
MKFAPAGNKGKDVAAIMELPITFRTQETK